MATTQAPRPHPRRLRRSPPGGQMPGCLLPVTLALRLGLGELVDRYVDLGHAPGRANTGHKMLTLVASALAGGDCIDDADVLRTGGTARALGGTVKAPSTLGTFLRSFRWGHVRSAGPGEPGTAGRAWAAGAGPGDGPLTIDLGLHHLRDLWTGQGGSAPPRVHRPAGLSSVAGRRRRHRRGADGPTAGGPGKHRPGCRPLPAGNAGPGAPRRSHRTTHRPGRQRLLHQRHRRRLPQDGCPLLHHRAPAPEPAKSHRGHPRGSLEAHPPTGWRALPTWPKSPAPPSRVSPTPGRFGSSSAG